MKFFALLNLKELEIHNIGVWPLKIRLAIIGVITVLFATVCANLLLMPVLNSIEQERNTVSSIKEEIAAKERLINNIEHYSQEFEQNKEAHDKILNQIPTHPMTTDLVENLGIIVTDSGLQQILIRPSKVVENKDHRYMHMTFKVKLNGDYHSFGRFLSSIAKLERLLTVHNLQINKASELLNFTMDICAYWLPESVIKNVAKVDSMPVLANYAVHQYSGSGLKSPFDMGKSLKIKNRAKKLNVQITAPTDLKYVGNIKGKKGRWGLLVDQSGTLHHVKVGDRFNGHPFIIKKILDDKMIVSGSDGSDPANDLELSLQKGKK